MAFCALAVLFGGGCARKIGIQAFIVTASRENVKLGLMTVHVFKRDVFEKFVADHRSTYRTTLLALTAKRSAAQAVVETKGKELEKDSTDYSDFLAAAKSAELEMQDSSSKIDEERASAEPNETYIRAMHTSVTDFGNIAQQALNAAQSSGEKAKSESRALQEAKTIVADCDAKMLALNDDFFAENELGALPALVREKTNADGTTELALHGDDTVLFAQAARSVGASVERYTWLIPNPDGKLMLSNDNAMDQPQRDSLISGK